MHTFSSHHAPQAIGPYSQAIRTGDILLLSGQIGLDPITMTLRQDSLEAETEQIISNITAVLEAAGLTRSHVVKTTIFLTDIGDFTRVNEVYGRYFPQKPARSTVAVAALPKGARIEIECIAEFGE